MSVVRCSVCKKFTGIHCEVKKGKKVKPNKSRVCDLFDFDETKVKIHKKIPTTRLDPLYWENKNKFKKIMKEEALRVKQQEQDEKDRRVPSYIQDNAHPLTGDLSRFVSSASGE